MKPKKVLARYYNLTLLLIECIKDGLKYFKYARVAPNKENYKAHLESDIVK